MRRRARGGGGGGASFEVLKLHSRRSKKTQSEKFPPGGTPAPAPVAGS